LSSRRLAQALAFFSVIGLATVVAAAHVGLHTDVSSAQQNAFLGRWKLTSTGTPLVYVGWLEVSIENGQLTARFSNRGGTPTPVASVQITNGELVFQPAAGRRGPSPEHRARVQGDRLTGSTTSGDQTIAFVGERPPKWPAADASATHQFGPPVDLFDGKSTDAFDLVRPDQPWFVINGEMTNSPEGVKPAPGSNLRSKQKFQDYRIHAEYKLDDGAHSGIYFRGRYEMQVLGDVGKPPDKFSHMSVYGWIAPLVNASKPDNEWQTMEGTIVANKITVFLNGQKVHDNSRLEAMTTNAVDPNELEPGPIQLVGNDGRIWYRKVTITPIVDTRR
jgi:3-keto-disaccharide hydrolase